MFPSGNRAAEHRDDISAGAMHSSAGPSAAEGWGTVTNCPIHQTACVPLDRRFEYRRHARKGHSMSGKENPAPGSPIGHDGDTNGT